MKTILIIVMMLFTLTASQAQMKGIPFDKAVLMEDVEDYNGVVHELRMEKSWIQETWSVYDDEWKIFMIGNGDGISVGVVHLKSSAAAENAGRYDVIPPVKEDPSKVSERALYLGRKDTDATGSEGITEGEGNQGSITGSPNSDNYVDRLSTGGGGINFSLAGRNPVSLPKPEYNAQVSGTIVVRIRVNRDGKVISAEPGYKGTNILDENMLEAARKAALKARFNCKSDAAYTQAGTITYHFVLQ